LVDRLTNVILISNYTKEFLPEKNKLEKVWYIENPIADSFFNIDWKPQPCRIFFCGRVSKLKNTLGLIKAFVLIAKRFPKAQLRVAGLTSLRPEYVSKCRALVKQSGLEDKVNFLGNISVNDVQKELSKANCLVIPSFQENAPLAIEEAMAAGVPVVGSKVGGVVYMIEEGKTGFFIDPYNEESIAESVGKILGDDKLASFMSENAKRIAKSRFMASVVCEKTVDVYKNILSGKLPK